MGCSSEVWGRATQGHMLTLLTEELGWGRVDRLRPQPAGQGFQCHPEGLRGWRRNCPPHKASLSHHTLLKGAEGTICGHCCWPRATRASGPTVATAGLTFKAW